MPVLRRYNTLTSAWEPVVVGEQGPVGPNAIINTDGDAGSTLYVGATDPTVAHTPVAGDVWIALPL